MSGWIGGGEDSREEFGGRFGGGWVMSVIRK